MSSETRLQELRTHVESVNSTVPARVRSDVERILNRAARRLLDEEIKRAADLRGNGR